MPEHRAGRRRAGSGRAAEGGGPRYPRTARVDQVLRQVIAEELERLADIDARLRLVTVTGVHADPDLRHATVWVGSLNPEIIEALGESRTRLQAAIGRQVRLKRTPLLTFLADPAVSTGARVEEILKGLGQAPSAPTADRGEGDGSDG